MRQNRRELLFAGGADKRKPGSSPKGLRMVRWRAAIVAAAVLCSFVCAWAETKLPVIAVVPFEAAGVSQEDADAFTARFAETLVAGGTVSAADSCAVGALLARQGLAASDLIDAERASSFAEEAGADFLVVGKLFSLGGSAGAFVTMLGVNPAAASVAVRQAESMDALMAAVPGLCAELLGSAAVNE